MVLLTSDEYAHYQRQLKLQGFGEASQLKLKAARVLVVGAGGLGSPVLLYLALRMLERLKYLLRKKNWNA